MSRLGKALISVGSLLIVAVVGILIYCYWPAITGTVNNNKYYTQEDVQKAYDDGFSDGNKSETELNAKYEYYKTLVDDYYIQVTTLNEEITKLSSENASYSSQVKNLTTQKNNLQSQVDNLNTIKVNNETTIADLNNQISSLQSQITNLTNSGEDKSEQIANLNAQVINLQKTVNQLQKTNQMNLETITSLNTQIASLNSQISELTENSQNYTGRINALNNKIAELQKSITYYETYISQLESSEQVVATFEFDGSVYNIQIVNKGSKLAVATPTSTTYKIFNGWTVNGQAIDLNTYTISANTKIIADITYKYDVKFKVGDEIISSQIITKNDCATLPTNPTKSGYEFDGWSINGVDVISNISSKQVTQNTTYIAVFTKLHTVTFVYENETKSTQIVRNGNLASSIDVVNTQYKVFNGWAVNDTIVDLSNYKIYSNTTFVADITYKYDVKFMIDEIIYNSQIITKNAYVKQPANPIKDGYEFDGWTINGTDIVNNITNIAVTKNTTYKAVFTKLHTVKFISNVQAISTQIIRNGGYPTVPTCPTKAHYIFNGWSVDGANVVSPDTYPITKETNFVAIFKIVKHSVKIASYWVMMGTPTILYETEIDYGTKIGKLQYTPTKEDYKCIGYETYSMMASDVDIENYVVVADVMFVPKWERTVSVVRVYDNDTLLYSKKYNTGDTFTLSSISPVGKENMRFLGWYRYSDTSHIVSFQGEVNAYKLIEKLGEETATNRDLTYYAYYEHLCMGKFISEDGQRDLKLTYDVRGSSDSFAYYIRSKDSDDPYLDNGTWNVDNGTFINETISGVKVQGVYDKNTDTWTITIYVNGMAATPYTLKRVAHTCGVSGYKKS